MDLSLLKQKNWKMSILSIGISRLNLNPIKISLPFYTKIKKNLKIHLNTERPSRVKAILSKRTVLEA